MHEIVDLIANFIFGAVGAASAAASVVCVAFSMPLLFFFAAMSTQTHTRFRRTKAGSVNFHLQKSVRIIFTLFPCGLVV